MKIKENIIAGLDVGTNSVRLVVGQSGYGGREEIKIIGAVEAPSSGINRGVVTSIEDATSAVSACLEKAERLVGVPVASVWLGFSGPHVKCEKSRGLVAVSRSDGEITEDDVARAVEAARALSVPANYEIIHTIPLKFSIDNHGDIKDPVGMNGVRLEVEALIVQGLSSQIKNLTKAVYRSGLEIDDLVLSPLAAAAAVIENRQKDLGAAIVDIGAATTSLAVFEEAELIHTAVLPVGSEHITSDLAIGLRCAIDLAEKVKLEFGNANAKLFNKKEEVNINELSEREADSLHMVSRKYIAEIVEARAEEIFEKIDEELKKINRSGMLPGGIYLVGNGAKLAGLVETAKGILRLPVAVGQDRGVDSIIDKAGDPGFLPALGLVVWGNRMGSDNSSSYWAGAGAVDKTIGKIKDIFSSLMP